MAEKSSKSTNLEQIKSILEKGVKNQNEGDYQGALHHCEQALTYMKSTSSSSDDIYQLEYDTYYVMTDCYLKIGELMEADKWVRKAEELAKKLRDEVKICMCFHVEGRIKQLLGNLKGALSDYNKSLEIRLNSLESGDISASISYEYIGQVYYYQGKYDDALSMYDKSLKIKLAKLGDCHSDIAVTYYNIGQVYSNQGIYDNALSMYHKSLEIQLAQRVDNHCDVAATYNNIGLVYFNQCNYDEALSMYNKSLKIKRVQLGDNHPDVAVTYHNIGLVYYKQRKYNDALSMYNKSLKIKLAYLDDNHPGVAATYKSIGQVYSNQGKHDDALSMNNKSLKIKLAPLGDNHCDVAGTYSRIGQVYSNLGKYDYALFMFKKSLNIEKAQLGPNHLLVAVTYLSIGLTYAHQGKYYDALSILNKALQIHLATLDQSHPCTAKVYGVIAEVYYRQSNYHNAIKYYEKSIENLDNLYGKDDAQIIQLKEQINQCFDRLQENGPIAATQPTSKMIHHSLQQDAVYQPVVTNPALQENKAGQKIADGIYNNSGQQSKDSTVELGQHSEKPEDKSINQSRNKEEAAIDDFNEKCFSIIANEIGDEWMQLARNLNICDDDIQYTSIQQLDHRGSNRSALANKMLRLWQKKNPSQDHLIVLRATLCHQKQNKIVKTLNDLLLEAQSDPLLSNYAMKIFQGSFNAPNIDRRNESSLPSEDVNNKEYLAAYNEALQDGECRNDFTKIVFSGPENVGKTTIMNIFTNEEVTIGITQTQIMDNTGRYINFITYNILDKKIDSLRLVLYGKVLAVIEKFKKTLKISPDASQNIQLMHIDRQLLTTNISTLSNNVRTNSAINVDHFTDTALSTVSTKTKFHKILIYEDFMRSVTDLKGKVQSDDSQYGKLVDFGGQAVYHVTHRPFLSGNSIYILVFNITHKFDDYVIDRQGKKTNMTYRHAMQEWLTSTIGSHDGDETIEVEINGKKEEYCLPVVILIASHGDKIKDDEERESRFKAFRDSIIQTLSAYKSNLCCSGIIFQYDSNDDSQAAIEQRKQTTLQLHELIKQFALSLPFMKEKIPIRWYLMASILHTSADDASRLAASQTEFSNTINRIHNIMTFEEVKQLAKDCELYESDKKLRSMLLYLHDIGDIVFCQKKGVEEMVVTNLDWLLSIFRSIIKLDDHKFTNANVIECYNQAHRTGIMSEVCINSVATEFELKEIEKEFLIQLMDSYNIICKIEDESSGQDIKKCPQKYFVPYLLDPLTDDLDLNDYCTSDWLYIGYNKDIIPYIPDGIFYCHLSACLKLWNVTQVKTSYRCAIYVMPKYPYQIILKKEESYIGLIYCYQKDPPDAAEHIKKNIFNWISEARLPFEVQDQLDQIIHERMPKFKRAKSRFYVKCSYCSEIVEMVDIPSMLSPEFIRCDQEKCGKVFKSKAVCDWMMNGNERIASETGSSEEEECESISKLQVKKALDTYNKDFIRIVPVDELVEPLKSKGILSSREVTDIKNMIHKEDKAAELSSILRDKRDNSDFRKFCLLLENHSVNTVRKFGKKLLKKAMCLTKSP
ncbi:Nephrocystin-3 [Trichoplax sp. H2]|nr:Nephrocystin-3 [Trichoplax sp. H2]|eukprot:RDD40155.1 Nephrocystin-3 [Trichoplax sp. H2]